MKELTGKIQKSCDGEYWVDGDVDAHFDDTLKHFGEGTDVCIAIRKYTDPSVAELCINIGNGQAVVTTDNCIEFTDCGKLPLADLEFLVNEAKAFIRYRDARNLVKGRPMLEAIKHKHIADERKMVTNLEDTTND